LSGECEEIRKGTASVAPRDFGGAALERYESGRNGEAALAAKVETEERRLKAATIRIRARL
jgi:hypothetical protein